MQYWAFKHKQGHILTLEYQQDEYLMKQTERIGHLVMQPFEARSKTEASARATTYFKQNLNPVSVERRQKALDALEEYKQKFGLTN